RSSSPGLAFRMAPTEPRYRPAAAAIRLKRPASATACVTGTVRALPMKAGAHGEALPRADVLAAAAPAAAGEAIVADDVVTVEDGCQAGWASTPGELLMSATVEP